MNEQTVVFLKNWFEQYAKTFYSQDEDVQLHVRLKEEHTWRVVEHATAIGKSLGLLPEDLLLAETTALFHDVGRFRQYHTYHTFNDARSTNHAALGLEVLKETQVLKQAGLSDQEIALVEKAVLYHNQRYLPEKENPKALLFAKILRDADKLDIFHIIVEEEMPRSPELRSGDAPSSKVIQDILAGKMARFEDVKTPEDQMLFRLSWLYNIYFRYTFMYILEQQYLEKMFGILPASLELQPVYEHLRKYADKQT